MTPEWKSISVQDMIDQRILLVEDGNHGENRPLSHEFETVGIPFVRPDDLRDGRINFRNCDRINQCAVARVRKGHGRPRDVLFTHRATVGRMALVRDDDPIFVANPGVTVWRSLNNAELDYRFLYYRMHAMDFLHQVWAVAGSTDTFPYVSLTQQKKLSLTLPPHKDQVCIGQILGLLDEKIDLNRRMNETLEAMARAIFKDWFVDFGPTRAKMEGQAPYLAPDLWALFPDRLNDEGKPVGWRNCKLLDLCELKRGYDLPTAERRPGPFPIISSSGVSGLHDRGMAKHPGVVTGRYGTIGEVFFLDEDFWPLNTALYVRDFKGNDQRYVYYTIRAIDFGIYSDKGAVPGINRNHLHAHIVLWAPLDVQRAFRDVLESSWTRQRVNRSESETLAATRDLLLPKLMSGELRVRDAEKLAEAVM